MNAIVEVLKNSIKTSEWIRQDNKKFLKLEKDPEIQQQYRLTIKELGKRIASLKRKLRRYSK